VRKRDVVAFTEFSRSVVMFLYILYHFNCVRAERERERERERKREGKERYNIDSILYMKNSSKIFFIDFITFFAEKKS